MRRLSEVGYWKLDDMPGSGGCLRQKHQSLNFWSKTKWGTYGIRVKSKWERRVLNPWNHIRKKRFTLNAYILVQEEKEEEGEGGSKWVIWYVGTTLSMEFTLSQWGRLST